MFTCHLFFSYLLSIISSTREKLSFLQFIRNSICSISNSHILYFCTTMDCFFNQDSNRVLTGISYQFFFLIYGDTVKIFRTAPRYDQFLRDSQVKRFDSPRAQSRKFRFCLTQIVGIHSLFRNGIDYFLSPDESQLHVHLISRDIFPSLIYMRHSGTTIVKEQRDDTLISKQILNDR